MKLIAETFGRNERLDRLRFVRADGSEARRRGRFDRSRFG